MPSQQEINLFKNKVNKIFNQYKITPLKPVDKFIKKIYSGKYNYRTICLDKFGNKYFFKMNFLEDKSQNSPLKNEIIFFKSLSEGMRLTKKSADFNGLKIQQCRDCDEENFEWILYSYEEGKELGNIFSFNKDFIDDTNSLNLMYITDLTANILSILKEDKKGFSKLKLTKLDYEFFISYLKENIHFFEEILGASNKQKIFNYFSENKELLNMCDFLSHRDNHTMNFIMNKKGEITIIDWNSICLSNYLYDFVEIWIHGYEFLSWQDKIAEMYFIRNKDRKGIKELFKMMTFYLTLKEIKHLNIYPDLVLGVNNGDVKKAKIFKDKLIKSHSERIKNII